MAMRAQSRMADDVKPLVVNVCNFAKPEDGQPALLSYDDARTLFHEFGHALHQMLSDVTYESISGTSVARDFVELPSQLYEHWLEVPEVLAAFATHAETGEPMPRDMLQRMLDAGTYDMGFQTVHKIRCKSKRRFWKKSACRMRYGCGTRRRILRMCLRAMAIPAGITATCGPR